MCLGLTAGFLALVALEVTLFDESLCFLSEIAKVAVHKVLLLVLVDGIPSKTDVNATGQADLSTAAIAIGHQVVVVISLD